MLLAVLLRIFTDSGALFNFFDMAVFFPLWLRHQDKNNLKNKVGFLVRITYRGTENKQYWEDRWDNVGFDEEPQNLDRYPFAHVVETLKSCNNSDPLILELDAAVEGFKVFRKYRR